VPSRAGCRHADRSVAGALQGDRELNGTGHQHFVADERGQRVAARLARRAGRVSACCKRRESGCRIICACQRRRGLDRFGARAGFERSGYHGPLTAAVSPD